MADEIIINKNASREDMYIELIPQIDALIIEESDLVANLSNISAALKEAFNFHWIGFYIVKGNELVLGPFQGPPATTRIAFGKGVCGTSWEKKEMLIVPDVHAFPGHIACSIYSKSEIVVPAKSKNEVFLVLDIDSNKKNDFSETDAEYLQQVIKLIEEKHGS